MHVDVDFTAIRVSIKLIAATTRTSSFSLETIFFKSFH